MKVPRLLTKDKYLFDRVNLLNHFFEVKLNKRFTNRTVLNRFIKTLNKSGNNVHLKNKEEYFVLIKNDKSFNLCIYLVK